MGLKRWIGVMLLLALSLAGLAGCSGGDETAATAEATSSTTASTATTPSTAVTKSAPYKLDMKATLEGGELVRYEGATNLPDGTKVFINLFHFMTTATTGESMLARSGARSVAVYNGTLTGQVEIDNEVFYEQLEADRASAYPQFGSYRTLDPSLAVCFMVYADEEQPSHLAAHFGPNGEAFADSPQQVETGQLDPPVTHHLEARVNIAQVPDLDRLARLQGYRPQLTPVRDRTCS